MSCWWVVGLATCVEGRGCGCGGGVVVVVGGIEAPQRATNTRWGAVWACVGEADPPTSRWWGFWAGFDD